MRYSIVALIVLLLPTVACTGTQTVCGTAPSDGFPAPSQDFVWDVAARALQESGLQPSSELSSKQTWTIQTHWRMSPQPFSNQGFRQQATVQIFEVPERTGYYYTETQVKRQVNDNMLEPSRMTVAQWGDETRCVELETLINRRIEMHFLQARTSDQFNQRYGVETHSNRIDCGEIDRTPQREPEPVYPGPRPGGTYGAQGGLPKQPDDMGPTSSYYGR